MSSDGPPPTGRVRAALVIAINHEHASLPTDMAGRAHQAFPVFSAEQIEQLLPFGGREIEALLIVPERLRALLVAEATWVNDHARTDPASRHARRDGR